MKKTTACILLITYLGASCAGLLPLLGDVAAHLFFYKGHMEHVHHGDEHHAHVATEIVQLLSDDHGYPASLSEWSGGKISLSAHSFLVLVFEKLASGSGDSAALLHFRFSLSTGAKFPVFMPPDQI